MIFIENTSVNPYFNLACEEYCLKNLDINETIVMLWRDDNAIIVGRHQNTVEEINHEFVAANNIKVVRRITGGGAVYHDLGNLNFTFIVNEGKIDSSDMKKYSLPVVNALKEMGIDAELSGRNDITIEGKKISGTAQAVHRNKLLYHGTLLFNSDMSVLSSALNVTLDKIESKGIKSVRSRVTNIKDYLKRDIDILEFKKLLLENFFAEEGFKEYHLSDEDILKIRELEKDKYSTWEWNYGESPKCSLKSSKRFPGGKIEVYLNIENGMITGCKFYGDFLSVTSVDKVEEVLTGIRYEQRDIEEALMNLDLVPYFGSITKDELISCLIQ